MNVLPLSYLTKGTGSALGFNQSPAAILTQGDEVKVSKIVEICKVSRDEAIRVLDACRMDEAMALERFLSGKETSTWSKVSKKKRPPARSRQITFSNNRGGGPVVRPYDRVQDHEQDKTRKERPRHGSGASYVNRNGANNRRASRSLVQPQLVSKEHHTSGGTNKGRFQANESASGSLMREMPSSDPTSQNLLQPKGQEAWRKTGDEGLSTGQTEGSSLTEKRLEDHEPRNPNPPKKDHQIAQGTNWSATSKQGSTPWAKNTTQPPVRQSWQSGRNNGSRNEVSTSLEDGTGKAKPKGQEFGSQFRASDIVSTANQRTGNHAYNYAAAVVTGSKAPSILNGKSVTSSKAMKVRTDQQHTISSSNVRNSNELNNEATVEGFPHSPIETSLASVPQVARVIETDARTAMLKPVNQDIPNLKHPGRTVSQKAGHQKDAARVSQSQSADILTNEVHLNSDNVSTKISGVAQKELCQESLNLQFGSFGLSAFKNVSWDPAKNEDSQQVEASPKNGPSPQAEALSKNLPREEGHKAVLKASAAVPVAQDPNPVPTAFRSSDPVTAPASSVNSVTSSAPSGIPVLPMGPAGTFPPPSYGGPFIMPALHGFSPAPGAYDLANDVLTSRGSTMPQVGSVQSYDPSSLAAAGPGQTGKLGNIPGLAEPSVMSGQAILKERLPAPDLDKPGLLGSTAMPTGIDPLGATYMIPGYHSLQYPVYPYPNPPTYTHTISHPNPFPYGHQGQLPTQSRNGMQFEEANALSGGSRLGSGSVESVYSPGGYLNTSVNQAVPKSVTESGFKGGRVQHQAMNNTSPVGMAGGVVHGLTHGEYAAGIQAINGNGTSTNVPSTWGLRLHNSRGEMSAGIGMPMNQSVPAGPQNSGLYATTHGGAPGGYWPQQGGYYS